MTTPPPPPRHPQFGYGMPSSAIKSISSGNRTTGWRTLYNHPFVVGAFMHRHAFNCGLGYRTVSDWWYAECGFLRSADAPRTTSDAEKRAFSQSRFEIEEYNKTSPSFSCIIWVKRLIINKLRVIWPRRRILMMINGFQNPTVRPGRCIL